MKRQEFECICPISKGFASGETIMDYFIPDLPDEQLISGHDKFALYLVEEDLSAQGVYENLTSNS